MKDFLKGAHLLFTVIQICLAVIINTITRQTMINPMFLQVTVLTVSGLSLSKIDDMPSFISQETQTICYWWNMFRTHPLPSFYFILLCSEIDSYVSKIRFITRPDLNTRNRKLFMGHNITSERDNLLKSQQAQESFIKQPNSEHISTLTPSLSDQNCVTVCQN